MDPKAHFVDTVFLWVLLIPFTSYCVVDSSRPSQATSWPTFLIPQTLLTVAGSLALYFYRTKSEYTFVATMLFFGMIIAAAAVDPTTITRSEGESLLSYGKRFILERARRAAITKLAVYAAAIIGTYTYPQYWYLAVYLVVLQLHYYKMAACIAADAGTDRPQDAPQAVRRKWAWRAVPAAIVLGLLLIGPKSVFEEMNYLPDAWDAFGGFTLMSAAIFVMGMLVRADA